MKVIKGSWMEIRTGINLLQLNGLGRDLQRFLPCENINDWFECFLKIILKKKNLF